jgi:hypothetical protein
MISNPIKSHPYETEVDRINETIIARQFLSRLPRAEGIDIQYSLLKANPFEEFDFTILCKGRPCAYIEVKARTITHTKYPTLILSLKKLISNSQLAISTGLPVYLLIRWKSLHSITAASADNLEPLGVIVLPIPADSTMRPLKLITQGRKDRGDPRDIMRMVEVDIQRHITLIFPSPKSNPLPDIL